MLIGDTYGSTLGPLLFLLYINDNVNNTGLNIWWFADATSLFIIVDDLGKQPIVLTLFYSLFYPITLGGHWGTTDEFATIPFHLDLFSAALVELAKSIPVHSLILSSHLFFCLPLFLFPFTVPCRIVFAKPEDLEAWPNHLVS